MFLLVAVVSTLERAAARLNIPSPSHQIPELILSELEIFLKKEDEESLSHSKNLFEIAAAFENELAANFGDRIVPICYQMTSRVPHSCFLFCTYNMNSGAEKNRIWR